MQKEDVSVLETAASKVQAGVDAEVRRLKELDREMCAIISKATKKQTSGNTAIAEFTRQLEELEKEKLIRQEEDRQRELELQRQSNEEAALQDRRHELEQLAEIERERLLLLQQEEEYQRELRETAEREKEAAAMRERKLKEDQAFKQMMDELNATIKRGYETLPSSIHLPPPPPLSPPPPTPPPPQLIPSVPSRPLPQYQSLSPAAQPLPIHELPPEVPAVVPVAQLSGPEQLEKEIAKNYRPMRSFSRKIVAELQNMPLYTVSPDQPAIPSPKSAHEISPFHILELRAGYTAEARQLLDEPVQPLPLDPLPEVSKPPILQRAQSYKQPDLHSPLKSPSSLQPEPSKTIKADPLAAKLPLHQISLPQTAGTQGKKKG